MLKYACLRISHEETAVVTSKRAVYQKRRHTAPVYDVFSRSRSRRRRGRRARTALGVVGGGVGLAARFGLGRRRCGSRGRGWLGFRGRGGGRGGRGVLVWLGGAGEPASGGGALHAAPG